MTDTTHFIVKEKDEGKRLDALLKSQFPEFSRSYFQYLIDSKLVRVNKKILKKREKPHSGDTVEVTFQHTPEMDILPEDIPLEVLYEDAHIIVINKPAGMVVHPAPGNPNGTFVNALLHHCKGKIEESDDPIRPGIVHRLDKETTGALVAAKTRLAHQKLVELFKKREVHKEYLAITIGNPGNRKMSGNIGRHPTQRMKMCMRNEGGKPAVSHLIPIEKSEKHALVKVILETGRTHQARVHLRAAGTPIVGDPTYGNKSHNEKLGATRQLLHAETLEFLHPVTLEKVTIKAPQPDDFLRFKKNLLAE